MKRIFKLGFGVLVVLAAIVYWTLTQVGVYLAISPALEGLKTLGSIFFDPFVSVLSNPLILAITLVTVACVVIVAWYRVEDPLTSSLEVLARCKEWLGLESPVVVRGSLEHGDVRWIGSHTRDGATKAEHRACPDCAVELEQEPQRRTETERPNTSITADEETREREAEAWENVFGREKDDSEEIVPSLVCPRNECSFSIQGEKHLKGDKGAVKKQFRTHFREMRAGGSDPFGKWHQRAEERLDSDLEPTPGDLWDAYVPHSDDDAVMPNQAFGHGLPGENETVSCAALDEHKINAEGIDRVIELFPDGFDSILAWLAQSEYLEKRREITRKMDEQGENCRETLQDLEEEHGSMVEQALSARYDRAELQSDLETAEYELDTAKSELHDLREDLDFDYLSFQKRRWFLSVKNDVADAVEYVAQLCAFAEYHEEITPAIEKFEERFDPYNEGENYMTSPDEEFLIQKCTDICQQLTDLHSQVRLELLPQEKTEWANETKDTFTGHSKRLPTYNEEFVARERERYEELFETEYGPLNEEQQKAIVRNDRHNLVDASAGTGKTLTLTYRFQYLYKRGVPLDDIVAITLTRDAAEEMKSRIADALDDVSPAQLNISTYHALARSIVTDSILGSIRDNWDPDTLKERYVKGFLNGADNLHTRHPEAIDEFEEHHDKFLRSDGDYIEEHKRNGETDREFIYKKYKEFIDNTRNFDQSPDEIREQLTKANRTQYHFGRAACAIVAAFLDHAQSTEEPVDFLDMVKTATRLGQENPEYFSGQFQHILFDEFQDVADPVLTFIETFLQGSEDTRLFAVGDDWQSVYGFRGSNPQYFIEFDDRFDGVAHTQLAINYRCPPSVVEAGVELMANSEEQQNEKAVEAFSDLPETPTVHKLGGVYESRAAAHVVSIVEKTLSGSNIEPTDAMVISRNDKKHLKNIRTALDEHGIPVDDSNRTEDPNGVQVQTIHKSKGTEAECVVLVNATDNTPDGLPSSEKKDELLAPAIANTADYYAEERRLCYVALTRAERSLHVVTKLGHESQYLDDISEFFEEERSMSLSVEGVLTDWNDPGADSNRPITASLDCGGYEIDLMAWHNDQPPELEVGQHYRLSSFKLNDNGYGEEIKLDESVDIEKLDPKETSTVES